MGDITKFSKSKSLKAIVFLFILLNLILVPVFSQTSSSNSDEQNISIQETNENNITINPFESFDESQVPIGTGTSAGASAWVFVRMILVLAIVIALIFLVFKLVKKNGNVPGDEDPFLRRVASISVGPGKSVQIVTLVSHAYIIGVSENNINLIQTLEDPELVNALNVYADTHSNVSKPANFAEVLNMFMGKSNDGAASKSTGKKTDKKVYDGSTQQVLDMLKKQSDRLNQEE